MSADEESRSFTKEFRLTRERGILKTVCISVITSLLTCGCVGWIVFAVLHGKAGPETHLKNETTAPMSADPPSKEKLTMERGNATTLYGRFTIQQNLLNENKQKYDPVLGKQSGSFKLNWTATRQFDNSAENETFKTNHDGCVILPKTGLWLVHTEVTFAYNNMSHDKIWVFMRINNHTMSMKKTITLPKPEYRNNHAHLPIDLTDVMLLKKSDILCIVVSDWRIVYASSIDNSLTLVYLAEIL